jgi:type IV pilus assembly protein PilB
LYASEESINAARVILDALEELEFITEIQHDYVLDIVRDTSRDVGEIVVTEGIATEAQAIQATAKALGEEFIVLLNIDIEKSASNRIPAEFAKKMNLIAIQEHGSTLEVAVTIDNVQNLALKDDIRRITKASYIKFYVATKADITRTIQDTYRADEEIEKIGSTSTAKEGKDATGQTSIASIDEVVEQSPVSKFVDLIVSQAITDRASDIHFETQEGFLQVRYRIDAVLKVITQAPLHMSREIISRVKILSDLDISVKHVPQDGRMSITQKDPKTGKMVLTDLRVATMPGVWGENITMRVLDNSQASLNLKDLGFSPINLERFSSAYTKPYGMILVVGPTGSGKSTTLYATLNTINSTDINILTIEDPVEYKLSGIKQHQVNRASGFDFKSALRAFLRNDPDVILVGEIRDSETAEMALRAGMTGHMVFSTLHTQSAAEALPRLADMGVEAHLINSTLTAALSQRLLRRLCVKCKLKYNDEEKETLGEQLLAIGYPWTEGEDLPDIYHSKHGGCKECAGTGYRGRLGVHEVLLMNESIKAAVVKGASADAVSRLGQEDGMVTMKQDALYKVSLGITDIKEVLRTVI